MTKIPGIAMADICLVTAVNVEFDAAASVLVPRTFSEELRIKTCRGRISGLSEDRRVTVLQCGMGAPSFAGRLSEHLRHHHYDALIVAGLAGGLDPNLKPGNAVIYDFCRTGNSKEKSTDRDTTASIRCDD